MSTERREFQVGDSVLIVDEEHEGELGTVIAIADDGSDTLSYLRTERRWYLTHRACRPAPELSWKFVCQLLERIRADRPSWPGGVAAAVRKSRASHLNAADGVVAQDRKSLVEVGPPPRPLHQRKLRDIFLMSRPPLLARRGNVREIGDGRK